MGWMRPDDRDAFVPLGDRISATTASSTPWTTSLVRPEGFVPVDDRPREDVARGVLFSLAAIPVGIASAVVIWRVGYVAAISSLVLSALAGWLYCRGARSVPQRGLAALVGVVLAGIVLSFLGVVASDLVLFYGDHRDEILGSPVTFVLSNVVNPSILRAYAADGALLLGFGVVGALGTMLRLRRVGSPA